MLKYEDISDQLDLILARRRSRWTLSFPTFDDLQQIVRKHIFVKFDLWDQKRPFAQWASKVIKSQTINVSRNHYGKVAPPCSPCACNGGGQICTFTQSGVKCAECPLYAKWEKKKQAGYNIKFASSVEALAEVGTAVPNESLDPFDLEQSINAFHEKMKEVLPEKLYDIYEMIYVQGKTDQEVSEALGLKSSEKDSKRIPGYRQIHNYREKLLEIAREAMKDFDLIKM